MHTLSKLLVSALLAVCAVPAIAATTHVVAPRTHGKTSPIKKLNASQKPADIQKVVSPAPAGAVAKQGCTPAQACLTPDECLDLYLVNAARKDHHLPQLKLDETLVKVARAHSKDMAKRGYFSHFEPATKRDPVDRYSAVVGYRPAEVIGENLGMSDEPLMGMIHDCLMKSLTHRENILDHEYVRVGIGVYEAPDGRTWLTEMFAGPAPASETRLRQTAKKN